MVYGMVWRTWHVIWYGLTGMAWYTIRPGGHGMLYDMNWRACPGLWYGLAAWHGI